MSYLDAPTSWPRTIRFRFSAALPQLVRFAVVKHAAAPHGPLGSVALAAVSRLSWSVWSMSTIRIARSSL